MRYAGTPAVSPDGSRVAFSIFRPGAAGSTDPGGADLYLMNADGTHQRLLRAHDGRGVALSDPAWTPDGRALYFSRISQDGNAQIERVLQDGSVRQVIVKDGETPTVSPKGYLAFVRTGVHSGAQTLWAQQIDGRGARPLAGDPMFQALAFPQFSPDGSRITFSAAGGPRPKPTRRSYGPVLPVAAWPAAPVAWAHGLPMDLWMVNVNGTNLTRLTDLSEDDPTSAWSPDGRWIAFTGALGLYLLDVRRGAVLRVHDENGGAGLTWLPR